MKNVTVVGGGVAGLASAALLAHEGYEVRLLEKNSRVGGRVGSVEIEGFRFDTGPSWFLMTSVYDHFFELLGTSLEDQLDLRLLNPGYRVFSEPIDGTEAESVTIPFGSESIAQVFEDIEPGSGKVLSRYLNSANQAAKMAERHFLYNPFTRLQSLLHPSVMKKYPRILTLLGTSLERFISQRFEDPLLQQILGYPAVFLGTHPSQAPALYHLMSALDLDEGVQYPMGGFQEIVESLEFLGRKAGVDMVLRAQVEEIIVESQAGKQRVTGVRWRDDANAEHVERADIVVSGADLHHTETSLVSPEASSYPQSFWDKKQSGPGAVIALLGVKGAIPQLPHHSLFFTRDWNMNFEAIFGQNTHIPNPASMYVCKPSDTDPSVAPKGHENLFVLIPVPADTDIGSGGGDGDGSVLVEEAVDRAIRQIEEWGGVPDLRERIVVRQTLGPADFQRDYNSWKGGMLGPSHILRQSAMFRAQNQSKKVEGLYYAGASAAPGVGVPMCLISAEIVLKRIRGDHSAGPAHPRHQVKSSGNRETAAGPIL